MLRRNARLRREYLYRKSLEEKEKLVLDKKKRIKEALDDGKKIPTELRNEEAALRKEIDFDDAFTELGRSHVDDEYARAGERDPKVLVTTSRDPTSRLGQFAKEVRLLFPNAQKINRGNTMLKEVVDAGRRHGFTDIVMVHETRGEPDSMVISHLPFGPTAYFAISNCVLRHDIKDREMGTGGFPHLIFDNFTSKLGERVSNILKHLFPVPKEESKRVLTFANRDDWISFRHHTYKKSEGEVELSEVGPRFELRLYQVKLGTVEMADAETEWSLRPYMNTAKKRRFL
eukprot:CAMPEP_0113896798 /NCGR_PEP_ID=MMETSP0780_2-20120614/18262_1 /TAXON_ID=652834 /ORGANISM="Palpitomonas bilix" /LENGTH=286 /DNA_ID=CAMNT_0000888067 /DNA_START=131 /DNA_END=992 /DNA_ORIENTATION=+ /assembly_acc=CAM_ASM_000599